MKAVSESATYDTMNTPDSFLTFVEAHETTLRATGYAGTTTLANFQALVKISESVGGFSYAQCAANYGADLWFTDSAGNVIPHEVDTWNTSGDSLVWVRLPELSPVAQGATSFTMHWGDAVEKAAHSCTTTNTWSGLLGVWHMNGIVENDVPQTEPDASGNGLDATPVGYNNSTTDISQMGRAATAVVGHARVNKNVTNRANTNLLKVPKYTDKLTDGQKYALGGWFRRTGNSSDATNADYLRLFANGGTFTLVSGNDPANSGGNIDVFRNATASPIVFNSFSTSNSDWSWPSGWVYLVFVSDGTTQSIYKDGRLLKSVGDAAATVHINDYGLTIGGKGWRTGNSLNGEYDEVRFYNGAISADRIKADYDTMSAPDTFVTYTTIATWTGAANDGDGANPLNWECSDSGVVVAGQLPNATYLIQSCTLSRDCDWSGLGTAYLADGAVIEMDGHSLTLPAVSGSGTVQNSASGDAKELTLALATNWTNSDTAFVGNLKLVKTEAGVLTSSIAQTYSGGTEVRRGTIQAPQSTAAYNASFTPFGTGTITVNSNAVFNAQSTVAYRNNVILNGGTIRGGAGSGSNNQRPIVMLERVTEDSAINQAVKAIDIGVAGTTTDLNGHIVAVSIANETYFRWYGSLEGVTGKIVASGGGFFTEFPVEARGIDLDVSSRIHFQNATHIRDYRAANSDYASATGAGLGIYVSGTYTPVGNYYCGCVMEDGSTLNLSGRTGYFTVRSMLANSNDSALNTTAKKEARRTVQFASGATVTVNLAGRTDLKTIAESESNYIVKWDSTFGQPTTTTFRLDAETAKRFSLRSDATGLRLNKKKGFIIIVK